MDFVFIFPIFAHKYISMSISKQLIITLTLLIIVASLYRVMPGRPLGFAPQIAMAIFGGAVIRDKKLAFLLPLLSMLISDSLYQLLYVNGLTSIMGFYEGQWINYLLFVGITCFGFLINSKKVFGIVLAALAAPTIYFIISNFLVWASNKGFGLNRPQTLSGLYLCYQDALPFYYNSIIATIVFTAVLFGTYYILQNWLSKKLHS